MQQPGTPERITHWYANCRPVMLWLASRGDAVQAAVLTSPGSPERMFMSALLLITAAPA